MRGVLHDLLVPETGLVGGEVCLYAFRVAVVKFTVLGGSYVGSVFLWQDFSVLDRLDGAVVVVLVDLFVDGRADFFVLMGLHDFVFDCGGYRLVDCGVVVTGPGREVLDGVLHFLHFDGVSNVLGRVRALIVVGIKDKSRSWMLGMQIRL